MRRKDILELKDVSGIVKTLPPELNPTGEFLF
jgi:hypothetical protein